MKLDLQDHSVSFISVQRGPHKIRHRDRSSWENIRSCVLVFIFLVGVFCTANIGLFYL